MKPLRVLIAEEEPAWHNELAQIISGLEERAEAIIAKDYEEALSLINTKQFNLAVLDLKLPGRSSSSDELGFQLARDIRASQINQSCGLLMLTGYSTYRRRIQALVQLNIYEVLNKDEFDPDSFVAEAKQAMLTALIRETKREKEKKHVLSFDFNEEHLTALNLDGPDRRIPFRIASKFAFAPDNLASRCDDINLLLTPPWRSDLRNNWRRVARIIGEDIYRALTQDPDAREGLAMVTKMLARPDDAWLRFRGPRHYLGVPFELLRDEEDYLILSHPIQRQVIRTRSYKIAQFHNYLDSLVQDKHQLRILLIASNLPPRIQAVDQEISALHARLTILLHRLGVPHEIRPVYSAEATFDHVRDLLETRQYHIVHYAGHGRYDDEQAERSGIYLTHNGKRHPMQAEALNTLLKNSKTQLFFLSCCLGARTHDRVGQGDFLGIMDAIVQADVPAVIGYRWDVSDNGAYDFALAFYDNLFSSSFSIEDALYHARKDLSINRGRDDETWASPVLVV